LKKTNWLELSKRYLIMARILVVDDDVMLQEMLVGHLQRSGHQADCASTLAEGLEQVVAGEFDVVFLDVQLPDGDGLEYLADFKAAASSPEVIIITGKGDEYGAEKAIRSGAWAYIEKPNVIRELLLHLTRVLQYREEKNRSNSAPLVLQRDNIIGSSPLLTKCLNQVAQAAISDASVLITGETGTGKELFARAIHENSKRADNNFITVDCAALPENLIESTLFGYVKGAFTGAESSREGLVRLANGGTLFLDEIGELPVKMQTTFLRVLQEGVYRAVGSDREEHSDFRVIAATNMDVDHGVDRGIFRNDLLYRLKAFSLSLPPLRKRKEDIKTLTRYFIARMCDRSEIECKGVAPEFIEHLIAYDWPGNVRELQQTLERVIASTTQTPTLFAYHLPEHFRIRQAQAAIHSPPPKTSSSVVSTAESLVPPPWQEYKKESEKIYISDLMQYAKGNITIACQVSGLSRTRLYQLREKYDLLASA
jgi:two-component system, NtrC family, response regulator